MKDEICKIPGFQFAAIHSGIKENPKKLDLALIYSEKPCSVAGTFTTNRVKAAPVLLDLKKIKKKQAQAIIVNSGNANACTGAQGLKNAKVMVEAAARSLKLSPDLVLVSSTGKIGIQLPIEKITSHLPNLVSQLDSENLPQAALGILTTDRQPKIFGIQGKIGKKPYTIVGFGKGAGMLEPNMKATGSGPKHATMLAYFMTDAAIGGPLLQTILNRVVDSTFNCITLDGDMSTNDTALVLANGMAGNPPIKANSQAAKEFEANFRTIAQQLALKMLEDGEGTTKVVEVLVKGAKSVADAKLLAYRVGRSQLVKTSFLGQDPNWGRLLAAAGYSGAMVNPDKLDLYYNDVKVAANGMATTIDAEKKAHKIMEAAHFTVTLDLKLGKSSFRLWTSDLTTDYVRLNAEYRT